MPYSIIDWTFCWLIDWFENSFGTLRCNERILEISEKWVSHSFTSNWQDPPAGDDKELEEEEEDKQQGFKFGLQTFRAWKLKKKQKIAEQK